MNFHFIFRILAKIFPGAIEPFENVKSSRKNWVRLRDLYKRRKHESTSSLEVFEDDSLEEQLALVAAAEETS